MANEKRLIDANKLEGEALCIYTYGGVRYIPLAALKRSVHRGCRGSGAWAVVVEIP